MTVHGDDIVMTIRTALAESTQAQTQSGVRFFPNPEMTFSHRDGRLEFDCIHRDWLRAYRITVEAIDIGSFEGEMGGPEWSSKIVTEEQAT